MKVKLPSLTELKLNSFISSFTLMRIVKFLFPPHGQLTSLEITVDDYLPPADEEELLKCLSNSLASCDIILRRLVLQFRYIPAKTINSEPYPRHSSAVCLSFSVLVEYLNFNCFLSLEELVLGAFIRDETAEDMEALANTIGSVTSPVISCLSIYFWCAEVDKPPAQGWNIINDRLSTTFFTAIPVTSIAVMGHGGHLPSKSVESLLPVLTSSGWKHRALTYNVSPILLNSE